MSLYAYREFLKCRSVSDHSAMVMENSKFIEMKINITSERVGKYIGSKLWRVYVCINELK